ncbi:MAG: iron dependent repressor, metal binding and dimerization domain protein [Thermoleophilaceae bacterium]
MTASVAADENPLVDGLERLPVHPTTLVIFAATLARRKFISATLWPAPLASSDVALDVPTGSAVSRRTASPPAPRSSEIRSPSLTESGRGVALEVLRHHRLLERYLSEELGVPWDRVHEEAEVLEHVLSEELEERIAAKLGHPAQDPHGDPIPTREGEVPETETLSLAELQPGDRATIVRVSDSARDSPLPGRARPPSGRRDPRRGQAAVRRAVVRARRGPPARAGQRACPVDAGDERGVTGGAATEADEATVLRAVPSRVPSKVFGRRRTSNARHALLGPSIGLALAAAAVTGCGGKMEEGGRAVTVPPGRSVEIVGEDFSFDPKTVLVEGGESGWESPRGDTAQESGRPRAQPEGL